MQALTQGLASGGPDAAHAQAGWLVAEREREVYGKTGYGQYTVGVQTLTATDYKRPEWNVVI